MSTKQEKYTGTTAAGALQVFFPRSLPSKKLMCAASDGYMHKPLHGGHRKLPGPWCMQAGLAAHLPLPRAVRALVCGGQSGPGSTMQQHGCVIRPRCAARVKVLALRGTQ